jgi:hypothetical protein
MGSAMGSAGLLAGERAILREFFKPVR